MWLPPYLTHVLQPLDVGVFQVYKHWHEKAMERALERMEFEYNLSSFFHDLHEIRQPTFPIITIKNAFKKSGLLSNGNHMLHPSCIPTCTSLLQGLYKPPFIPSLHSFRQLSRQVLIHSFSP
jgi:hypothetical protein